VPLVTLTDVGKRYRRHQAPAVSGLSFAVGRGEILALLGPSGCGKTTTLRLIAGFETPDEGTITISGRTVADATPGRAALVPPEERGVGIVFQDYALFPHLTVEQNVAFGLHRLTRPARQARVAEVLRLVDLGSLDQRYPHELSGGQQQRVALARALAPAPTLLLLDEPFSNLDADLRSQMREEVERVLRNTGTTAIFVTHDQEEAFTIADRVGVLRMGRLEQLGEPEVIYHRPATTFVAGFVGAADFLPGEVTARGIVTEIGTFPNTDGRPAGERVHVMIRPDDVTFAVCDDGAAVILKRSFRGSETVYCLGLPSGRRVFSSQPSAAGFTAGLRVRVAVHALHVVTFGDADHGSAWPGRGGARGTHEAREGGSDTGSTV
jgi:iron(III) transport system ATP-binding protein